MTRKIAATVLAAVTLSLTAGCGTADPLNNGDSPKASAEAGDSHFYPNVGTLPTPPQATAKAPRLPKHVRWVPCPNSRTYKACYKPIGSR